MIKFGNKQIMNRQEIRPAIKGMKKYENISIAEEFQNETLRPIIKLQHDLLIDYFKDYLRIKKINFIELSSPKKLETLHIIFKNDNKFKIELKGLILGHFTTEEYAIYRHSKSDFNKRILAMIQQRIATSVLVLC
ncbi:MAG: hypothetical protein ACI8ZX_000486 [Planctomycetota bacterium]|jgi:hypothetical protein